MNIKIIKEVGVATITSSLKEETIKYLEANNPNALVTVDENGNETFRIATGEVGQIKDYCIVYSGKNAEGYAVAKYDVPSDVEDVVEFVVDKLVNMLSKAEVTEYAAQAAYDQLQDVKTDIKSRIIVVE